MAEPAQQAAGPDPTTTADADADASIVTKGSSELQIILHPLVLLTISDYITRHTLRGQDGPIIGALLGQQNGRTYTIEHAFDVHTVTEGGFVKVQEEYFKSRLDQMITVHKDRSLDLVGWYTLLPSVGPTASILRLHQTFFKINESALLLSFHPEEAVRHSVGGKLPLTIYESVLEIDDASAKPGRDAGGEEEEEGDKDKVMADSADDDDVRLRFRELAYSVETHETEMISMNYVASGGGGSAAAAKEEKPPHAFVSDQKGKRRIVESGDAGEGGSSSAAAAAAAKDDEAQFADTALTRDEEEMLASLTTKANAIKMLQSRINVLATYLERLPPSFVGGGAMDTDPAGEHTEPSHAVLRQIQALVTRLGLVIPSDNESFERELLHESNDVALAGLLGSMMQGTQRAREVEQKFAVIESARQFNLRLSKDPGLADPRFVNPAADAEKLSSVF
ncbi:hypothetical protein N3K66_008024 [Trichothecium roseum]|uniref:Uncharacterized protein n=1 Tax=Trichothecium roseum TaxID=47278 RepID=A0ACC0UUU3_9HYPO|nr:hypothetical protein N3K66_008024 [Trichothecium roseum]